MRKIAGALQIVKVVSNRAPAGGSALRVIAQTDLEYGQKAAGGSAIPVYVVGDDYPVQGNTPVPMVIATALGNAPTLGQRPIPVYVVSGTFDPTPPPPAIPYLLRDRFTTDADPVADGDATPGPGIRNAVGSLWYAENNVLFGGAEVDQNTWGVSAQIWTDDEGNGFDREQGRTLWALLRPADRQAPYVLSWKTNATPGDPRAVGHGWIMQDGSLDFASPLRTVNLAASIYDMRPMLYLVAIVLLDTGAAVLISAIDEDATNSPGRETPWSVPAYPLAAVAHITRRGSDATLWPSLVATSSPNDGEAIRGHQLEDIRMLDVVGYAGDDPLATFADRFTRADGAIGNDWAADAGVWEVVSNAARCTNPSGISRVWHDVASSSDGVFQWTVTTGATYHVNCLMRRQSATEYVRLTSNGDSRWALQILPSFTTIGQSGVLVNGDPAFPPDTTRQVAVFIRGNKYFILIDDIPAGPDWLEDGTDSYLDATGIGIGDVVGFDATTYDNVAFTPLEVELDSDLQEDMNLARFQVTLGSTIGADDFVAPNGTNITAHTPDAGGAWTVPTGGGATIQGNELAFDDDDGTQIVVQEVGTIYHHCEVTISIPDPLTRFLFAGVVPNCVDANNWITARIAVDLQEQPDDNEVEILVVVGGVEEVVGKTQFGIWYTDGSHNPITLSADTIADDNGNAVIVVYLDGHIIHTHYPREVVLGTKAGVYRQTTDDEGCRFSGWLAKATS